MFGLDGFKPLIFRDPNDPTSTISGLFSQEILVIQLGKCSVVVSRRIAASVLLILSSIFLYFSWFHDFGVNQEGGSASKQSIQLAASWSEFIEECGSSVVISNNIKATEIFKRKYKNNFINWSGYFIEKKQVNSFSFIENNHAWNVLVKMEPSETELQPDIVLSLTGTVYQNYKDTIDSLVPGDQIYFDAKFINLGDEFNVNHLHAISIRKTGVNKSLPDVVVIESALPESIPDDADEPPSKAT